jgi:hypothetical protein
VILLDLHHRQPATLRGQSVVRSRFFLYQTIDRLPAAISSRDAIRGNFVNFLFQFSALRAAAPSRPPIKQSLLHGVKADQVALGIED